MPSDNMHQSVQASVEETQKVVDKSSTEALSILTTTLASRKQMVSRHHLR